MCALRFLIRNHERQMDSMLSIMQNNEWGHGVQTFCADVLDSKSSGAAAT